MGFVSRIFGGGGGQAAPAVPAVPPVAAPAPPPAPPTPPPAPSAPPQFQQGATPGSKAQTAAVTATSILGAGAASGQKATKTLLG